MNLQRRLRRAAPSIKTHTKTSIAEHDWEQQLSFFIKRANDDADDATEMLRKQMVLPSGTTRYEQNTLNLIRCSTCQGSHANHNQLLQYLSLLCVVPMSRKNKEPSSRAVFFAVVCWEELAYHAVPVTPIHGIQSQELSHVGLQHLVPLHTLLTTVKLALRDRALAVIFLQMSVKCASRHGFADCQNADFLPKHRATALGRKCGASVGRFSPVLACAASQVVTVRLRVQDTGGKCRRRLAREAVLGAAVPPRLPPA